MDQQRQFVDPDYRAVWSPQECPLNGMRSVSVLLSTNLARWQKCCLASFALVGAGTQHQQRLTLALIEQQENV